MATKKTKKVDSSAILEQSKELVESNSDYESDTKYIETGNIGFDMVLTNGLGIPVGSSILLWAEPGCGKTTLSADTSKRLINIHKAKGEEFKVLYIDVEGSKELFNKMGLRKYTGKEFICIDVETLAKLKGKDGESYIMKWRTIEMLLEKVLSGKDERLRGVKFIIIDSVNNVLSDQNEKNSIADGDFGTRSRERANFYSKYLPQCKAKGISVLLLSQIRQKQDAGMNPYAEKKRAAVSDADLHNVDIIIKCKPNKSHKENVKLIEETTFGVDKCSEKYIMELDPTSSSCKNRYDRTHKCEIMIEKGVGVCNYYVLRKLLVFHKFLKENSGWYTFTEPLCQAFDFPNTKLRKDDVDKLISEKPGPLVSFLKEVGCYSVTAPDRITREEGSLEEESDE